MFFFLLVAFQNHTINKSVITYLTYVKHNLIQMEPPDQVGVQGLISVPLGPFSVRVLKPQQQKDPFCNQLHTSMGLVSSRIKEGDEHQSDTVTCFACDASQ